MGPKVKGLVRVTSTQNFEDFKGFQVINRFSKTLISDIECMPHQTTSSTHLPHHKYEAIDKVKSNSQGRVSDDHVYIMRKWDGKPNP